MLTGKGLINTVGSISLLCLDVVACRSDHIPDPIDTDEVVHLSRT